MKENTILLQELSNFIKKFIGLNENDEIDETTTLEEDITMTGDDAYEFIIEYGKLFNVDVSNFLFDDYFHPEGFWRFSPFYFHGKLIQPDRKKDLTVGDLIKGINAGRLDESILG